MKTIKVLISWSGNNYCAGTGDLTGVVLVSDKTIEGVKKQFEAAFAFHTEDSMEKHTLEYEMQISAILHQLDGTLTRSALSRITGINQQ